MKKIFAALFLGSALSLSAQTTVSSFSAPLTGPFFTEGGSWAGQISVSSGSLTVGGTADNSGSIVEALITDSAVPIDGNLLISLTVTARLDAGNAAPGFTVSLFDDQNGAVVAFAIFNTNAFSTGSFTSATQALTFTGNGNLADIQSFGLSGSGTTDAFRVSFDHIVANAVPEPSTYAAILGAMALAFVAYRRRLKAA